MLLRTGLRKSAGAGPLISVSMSETGEPLIVFWIQMSVDSTGSHTTYAEVTSVRGHILCQE